MKYQKIGRPPLIRLVFITIVFGLLTPASLLASSLIYVPNNPSFGGNYLNGSVLMNSAQAQNKLKDPAQEEDDEISPLEEFNDRLQRALLNRLTNTLSQTFVDEEGNLIPGQTETTDFIIDIIDLGDGRVQVSTTDRITGEATTFSVESSF
ncbi:MAG: curli assembly protein CsgF [Moraxellaceae bacterium]|nr:MAG: curli assembly protein CsgF [Moraxellaceae bacterium]